MVNGCERNYHRAFKQLQRLKAKVGQALPPAAAAESRCQHPQPEQSKTTSAKLGSVRQNPKNPPPAAPQPPVADPPDPLIAGPLAGQHVPASPPKPNQALPIASQPRTKQSTPPSGRFPSHPLPICNQCDSVINATFKAPTMFRKCLSARQRHPLKTPPRFCYPSRNIRGNYL
jgi:hypothetical protein